MSISPPTFAPTPLRFGVLGAARIAPPALLTPVERLATATVTRIAARDRDRAEAFASAHGIDAVSDSYRDVIEADDVDVIYNPLPMSLHAEWTIAALRAGKHVLCEKPFAANADEAAAMVQVADETGQCLGEAFHYRYHPFFERLLHVIGSGAIGAVRHIEAEFSVSIAKPDLRWRYDLAGGSTMDLGCYPVHWVRHIIGDVAVTAATATVDDDDAQIDAAMTIDLAASTGTATAQVQSSMTSDDVVARLKIIGTDGEIIATNPLAPQHGNDMTITTSGGTTSGPVDGATTYDHMLRAWVDHVRHGTEFITSGDDAIANMAVIDAAYQAAGLSPRGR